MSWFKPKEIVNEIKKIRWPNKNDLLTNSVQVVIVVIFFALFFYVCQFIISIILNIVGGM